MSELTSLVRVSEAARQLKVSEKTLRRWLISGKIAGQKIAGLWFVRTEQMEPINAA